MAQSTRVLIVEDDPEVRDSMAEYLTSHGYEVDSADGGEAMRAVLAKNVPQLVLLDLKLPGEDGLALARSLRERHDVAIIMVTAADSVVDRVVGLEVGADDYIAKPFDLRELLARVKSVLRRAQAGAGGAAAAAKTVKVGSCTLDLGAHRLLDAAGDRGPAHQHGVRPAARIRRAPEPGALSRPAARPDPQPRVGAVRPLDRHPDRTAAAQARGRS